MSDKASLQNFAADVSRRIRSYGSNMPGYIDGEAASRHNVNSQPVYLDNDSLQQGISYNGKISTVRRFFLLLATFDLFFMLLLWLICTVASGLTLKQAFRDDVFKYDIKTSMFDVFMVAAVRFTCLILAYALFQLRHVWVVALTTALSCAFLIAKVFLYNFNSQWSRSYTLAIFLLIASFVIAWTEAWFFDFKVLPLEKKAFRIIGGEYGATEHSSLLHRYLQSNYTAPSETVGTFYSPFSSPPGSVIEEEDEQGSRPLTPKEKEFKRKGKETLEEAWSLVNAEGWVLEKTAQSGDTVHSKRDKLVGKMFLLSGEVEFNAELLLEELFYKMEDCPKWNPTVLYSKVIQKIDSHTDISYNVAAEGAGGLVAARDFVNLRHWELRDGVFISCGVAVTHPDMPPQKQYTRGENGPGAWVIRTIPDDPHKCHFQWLLNTNLKGWIPQYLVDQALSGVMLAYIEYIRLYTKKLREEQVP